MALLALNRFSKSPGKLAAMPVKPDERSERKADLQAILEADEVLRQEVGAAQAAREQRDSFVAALENDPVRLAQADEAGYAAALQERISARMALGHALIKRTAYSERHDLPALRAELAAICDDEKQEAQARLRGEVGLVALDLLADLRHASETYARYCALWDEAMAAWPREADAVMHSYPLLPPGALSPNGLRSLQNFWSDQLMVADPTLLPEDDPRRVRYEDVVAKTGKPPRIFAPGLIWGDQS